MVGGILVVCFHWTVPVAVNDGGNVYGAIRPVGEFQAAPPGGETGKLTGDGDWTWGRVKV